MYTYRIKEIVKIYDGDTITVVIDLGFNTTRLEILRLASLNTPEIRGDERPAGLESRDWLRDRLNYAMENNQEFIIKTEKDHKGKYGRYIATLFVDGVNINEQLISEGLAEYREY